MNIVNASKMSVIINSCTVHDNVDKKSRFITMLSRYIFHTIY